jgi:DNA replication and repair protein RecF
MWVSHLELLDYRSYAKAQVDFPAGPVVLVGDNGQGKTNLVEAVGYVATLASHRVAQDSALIASGRNQSLIRLAAQTKRDREVIVEIEINRGKSNRARINRNQVPRTRDVLGTVRCVVFAPEDLRLVRGDPSDRRRFLDEVMVQVAPRYLGLRSEYDRVVKQRNALLRTLRGGLDKASEASLQVWDEQLVGVGSELLWGRLNAARRIAGPMSRAYQDISDSSAIATIGYRTAISQDGDFADLSDVKRAMTASLERRRSEEISRAVTLVGPHRDDLELSLGSMPAKGYASHGESWSICLALRLASYAVMSELTDDAPVLILDDVFAELDSKRRRRLVEAVMVADQVLVTAAVAQDVPEDLRGSRFTVTRTEHSHVELTAES